MSGAPADGAKKTGVLTYQSRNRRVFSFHL
jgi:hypothetical protein